MDEVEEGEILLAEQQCLEEDETDTTERIEELEGDLLKDEILAQKVKEKDKAVIQKGVKRVQKAKAQDANPAKSTRSSRQNH